jgi:hypothetical protein
MKGCHLAICLRRDEDAVALSRCAIQVNTSPCGNVRINNCMLFWVKHPSLHRSGQGTACESYCGSETTENRGVVGNAFQIILPSILWCVTARISV